MERRAAAKSIGADKAAVIATPTPQSISVSPLPGYEPGFIDACPYPVFFTDAKARILHVNAAFSTVMGYQIMDVKGHSSKEIMRLVQRTPRQRTNIDELCTTVCGQTLSNRRFSALLSDRVLVGRRPHAAVHLCRLQPTASRSWPHLATKPVASYGDSRRARQAIDVVHDLRGLLSVISGNIQLLRKKAKSDGDAQKLKDATRACFTAARLATSMLEQSTQSDSKVVHYPELLNDIKMLMRSLVGPEIRLRLIHPALWPVTASPAELSTAILNILANAKSAMEGRGLIELVANNVMVDARSRFLYDDIPAGRYTRLSIRDTGIGMTPDVFFRAFDPYFTTKPHKPGHGIGLANVLKFARQSGGTAMIRTRGIDGTDVEIYLPVAACETAILPITIGAKPLRWIELNPQRNK